MVETIVAMGVLMAGFFLFAQLFVYGVRGMDRGADQAKAVSVAVSELGRLRSLSASHQLSTLLAEDGRSYTVDGFRVNLEVFERETYSPSTEWEKPFLGTPQARNFPGSETQATVKVSGRGAETIVTGLFGQPQLSLGSSPLEIRNVPSGNLAGNASVTLEAQLTAQNGSIVPATFDWYILPGTGNATIKESRNGREATLINQVIDVVGAPTISPGTCQVQVRAVYFGTEITSAPYSVNLGN